MNLFLDIETSGLVGKGLNWRKDYLMFPHVASIAWKIDGIKHYYIIKDTTYVMPKEAEAIHGISTAMVYRSKHNPLEVYELLAKDLDVAEYVIGHNIYFDSSIIKANAVRYFGNSMLTKEIDAGIHKNKRLDTMRIAQPYMGGKWKILPELYEKLFNRTLINAHSADVDVDAVEACFLELKRLRLVKQDNRNNGKE